MSVATRKEARKRRMPDKITERMGIGRLEKGKWNQFDIIAWDFTEDCTQDKCPLFRICEYRDVPKRGRRPDNPHRVKKNRLPYKGKCGMQLRYMKNALAGVILLYGDKGGRNRLAEMVRIGYHLLPLYNQLFQFSRLEYAEKELMSLSERGAIKINPLYKEIREIIVALEAMWTKIDAKANPSKGRRKGAKDNSDEEYLDAMFEVVGQNMKSLPLKNDGKDDEIFDKITERACETGSGIDFEEVGIPDKMPKKKKPKTKAQIEKERQRQHVADRKCNAKKKKIKRYKEEARIKKMIKERREKAKANSARVDREKAEWDAIHNPGKVKRIKL